MELTRIGVFPSRERTSRAKLFDRLEEAFAVRFEPRDGLDFVGLDAALLLPGADHMGVVPVPHLRALGNEAASVAAAPGLGERQEKRGQLVTLTSSPGLDRRLRDLRLHDGALGCVAPIVASRSCDIIGLGSGGPVWVRNDAPHGAAHTVAVAPLELGREEALRDRIRDGRFLAMTALVHFVRQVSAGRGWISPALSASFLFDDPNLHWRSYGYVRYSEIVQEADRHGFHVAFAMIPLDAWFAHPAPSRLFRKRPDRLSLVVHGNNHEHLELARDLAPGDARAMLAQAVRRITAFERRTEIPVGRIMVAPHGVCSREVTRALAPTGFTGLCISRPYPWLARPPRSWLTRPDDSSPLAGWFPASTVENRVPVMLRRPLTEPHLVDELARDLALRAFLDQPLIVQAHHGDVSDGLDRLGAVAQAIHRLGDVQWKSLGKMAADNFATLLDGSVLHVRLFTRHASVPIPDGVDRLVVEMPALQGGEDADLVAWSTGDEPAEGERNVALLGAAEIPVEHASRVQLRVVSADAATDGASPLRAPLRAIARRAATETRDRLTPVCEPAVRRLSQVAR